jgi:putative NIF3 family GTP cyclohydrolase 1 type 2
LLRAAIRGQCDCFVTGEARFHTAVEADAAGIAMILVGHYSAERYGIEHLAERLAAAFPNLDVWPATKESDPLRRV